MPGPGMYERNDSSATKAYTIGGKFKEKYNQNPGPGSYNANASPTKDSTRTYAIGNEKRTLASVRSNDDLNKPGPGMYEMKSSISSKAYTIGAKTSEKYNQNPGPGAYDASPEKVKDTARTYAIGSEKRTTQFGSAANSNQDMPGPGMYQESNTNNGKSYTISGK